MRRSASTARLQLTHAWYAALVPLAALAGPPALASRALDRLLGAAALLLVALACLGRIWCSAFIAGHKDVRLVTAGPYALCRHPLYVLSFLGGLGLGLATRSIVLTAVTALLLAGLFARAARAEERLLAVAHPQQFARYAGSTPRWWPRFAHQPLPEAIELRPRVYWKAFLDAGSFVLLYLLIEGARVLREMGVTPTLAPLP